MSVSFKIPNVLNNNQSNEIPILVPIDSKPVSEVVTLTTRTSESFELNVEESQLPVKTKIIPVKKKSFFESFSSKGTVSRNNSHENSCRISLNPLERTLSFLRLKAPEKEKLSGRKSDSSIKEKSEVNLLSTERRAGQIILRLFLNGRRRSSIQGLFSSIDIIMTVQVWKRRRAAALISSFLNSCSMSVMIGHIMNKVKERLREKKELDIKDATVIRRTTLPAVPIPVPTPRKKSTVGSLTVPNSPALSRNNSFSKKENGRKKSNVAVTLPNSPRIGLGFNTSRRNSESKKNKDVFPSILQALTDEDPRDEAPDTGPGHLDHEKYSLMQSEKRWLKIDSRFNNFIKKNAVKKTEKSVYANYTLSLERKSFYVEKIYRAAKDRLIDYYEESVHAHQLARDEQGIFSIADAVSFINGDMTPVDKTLKPKKLPLPFMFYQIVWDEIVNIFIVEGHKENRTYTRFERQENAKVVDYKN